VTLHPCGVDVEVGGEVRRHCIAGVSKPRSGERGHWRQGQATLRTYGVEVEVGVRSGDDASLVCRSRGRGHGGVKGEVR
jgi:hypothetical protein